MKEIKRISNQVIQLFHDHRFFRF